MKNNGKRKASSLKYLLKYMSMPAHSRLVFVFLRELN